MAIIGALPDNLSNGTEADASQVMADLNFIVNAVNAGAMPISPGSFTTNGNQTINGTLTVNEQGNSNQTLLINSPNDTAGACIMMVGNGATTPNKYLQVQGGTFHVVNSAATTSLLALDDSGNLTVPGIVSGSNLTGTSDERLKKDWAPFKGDFLERVAEVLHGTYTRTDTGERRVGAGAQSLRSVLPEAVFGDDVLCVSEGSAALAIVIELTREVLRLRDLLEPVK